MKRSGASPRDARLAALLRDHGYRWTGHDLICSGIRGFSSDEVVPHRFRSIADAAEYLCPIVRSAEYTERLVRIMAPASDKGR